MRGCRHRKVKAGPRIPARWGTFATQICEGCGGWRVNHVVHGGPRNRFTLAPIPGPDGDLED